jgi:phosphoribosylaminoimidazole carboxylase PurK protein
MSQSGTIGIVGGGQLGRMLTEAALKLGFQVVVVDPGENCPAKQAGAQQIVGALYDPAALQELGERSDYITVEIEHLDAQLLATIGKPVNPAPQTITLIQDKLTQKQFLQRAGVPVAAFVDITDKASATKAWQAFGGKMVLKTRKGAYDGRGNQVVSSEAELSEALQHFAGQELYAEKFVPFQKELAIMVARDMQGNVATYPLTETIQQRNICIETLTPAAVSPQLVPQATQFAAEVAQHLEGAGVFGIEMFLTDYGQILINEVAPRVHNSGHYTIEACQTSQFEQHIRAITGGELGSTALKVPAAVMVNILGERDGTTDPQGIDKAEQHPHTYVHLYGKSPTKVDRKMGHITVTADSVTTAKALAEQARAAITI